MNVCDNQNQGKRLPKKAVEYLLDTIVFLPNLIAKAAHNNNNPKDLIHFILTPTHDVYRRTCQINYAIIISIFIGPVYHFFLLCSCSSWLVVFEVLRSLPCSDKMRDVVEIGCRRTKQVSLKIFLYDYCVILGVVTGISSF